MMIGFESTITKKGNIKLPENIRDMLDVLPGDPAKEPVKLDELSNVIITPHCAGASGRKRYIPWILEQFNRFFSGEKNLPGMVSAERTLTMTIETPNLKKG
jgi:hypothetical protein